MYGFSEGTKTLTLEQAEQLNTHFKQFIENTNKMMDGAIRHSISETLNAVRDRTKSLIMSSGFNATRPVRRQKLVPSGGAPLVSGAQAYMIKGNNIGFVHILGNRENDGTWMLRFYEGGTVERMRNDKSLKALPGFHFFSNASSNIDSLFYNEAQTNINKTAKEING